MHFELSIINGKTVFDIIRAHRDECIRIVRDAYIAHDHGQSVNPDSYFLRFPGKPDCRIIALPAYLGDGFDVAGLKWIASYPGNTQRGFPTKPVIPLPYSKARSSPPREQRPQPSWPRTG